MSNITLTRDALARKTAENRVVTISGYLRVITGLMISGAIVLIALFGAWCIWSPTAPYDSGLFKVLEVSQNGWKIVPTTLMNHEFSVKAKLLMMFHVILIFSYVVYCLSRVHRLFNHFHKTKIFIKDNSKLLRNLGYALIAGIVLGPLLRLAFVTIVGVLDTPGLMESDSHLSLSFAITDFMMRLLTIGVIFLSAWVIDIGRELFTETELTI